MRIVIIGAGPGGICLGVNLRKAGFHDFVILEKAPKAGGVWWHNAYPGAECDVQSHLYSFSFALKPDWTKPYATQPEILDYLHDCSERFGLTPHIRYGTEVLSAEWDARGRHWIITMSDGATITTDVFVSAIGMFNEPVVPSLPGLEDFEGTIFHSARWQPDHDFSGRNLAIVGSAASAVQIAPKLAPLVERLYLFQRTATWVLPKDDEPFDAATIERFRSNPIALRQHRLKIWRDLQKFVTYDTEVCGQAERACLENMSVVEDPSLRAKLTPSFPFGRKRPLLSRKYYPIFNLPNVELVATRIDHVEPAAIVTTDGDRRPVDTIVMATGFATTKFASAIDIRGEGGLSLTEAWSDGAQAYLGMAVAGFPNLFMLYGPNTNAASVIFMIECQTSYILRQMRRMKDEGIQVLSVRRDVQDFYNEQLQRDLEAAGIYGEAVNTYYKSASGRVVTQCPYLMRDYREMIETPDTDAYEAIGLS